MAAAAVTSPDPFTFHCPAPPPAASVDADADEFEFRVVPAAAAALSAADELFSGGKLVPLHRPAPASAPCSPPPCLEVEPATEPTSPRAPRCAGRRWRDLLHLVSSSSRKAKDDNKCAADGCLRRRDTHFRPLLSRDSSSSSSASSVDSGKHARRPPPPSCSPLRTRSAPVANLLSLMSRTRSAAGDKAGATAADADAPPHAHPRRPEPACAAHPLLTRASSSSSASSSDSGRNPRATAAAAPWRARATSRPSRRPAVAAESPRVSASGRVVFRGLERCSSTPASAAGIGGPRRPRPRGMERSYSANVRVDPVINVFGFGLLFMPSSPAKERKPDKEKDSAGRSRNRPEKLAMVLRDPQD
ncbi:unnamed protein product [Urochloa decumbens]|uniref:Uncharacterized protein n=1 Tax=Urochloa decumbens TaxID=240449 RepID=A0ABC9CT59_9POAL